MSLTPAIGITILVVDDDLDILESVQDALSTEGFHVLTAVNGAEALKVLRSGARPAIVLLDLMMPVMNGFEFLEAQAGDPQIASVPVLVVSADASLRVKTAATSATGFVQKPFKLVTILEAIKKHSGYAT